MHVVACTLCNQVARRGVHKQVNYPTPSNPAAVTPPTTLSEWDTRQRTACWNAICLKVAPHCMLTLILLRPSLVRGGAPKALSAGWLVAFACIKQQQILKKSSSVVQKGWWYCRHFRRISGRALLNGLDKAFTCLWTWWKKQKWN